MRPFYGYNVIGNGGGAHAHLLRLQPKVMFYMNAWGEAKWAAQNLPNTVVIHRIYEVEEADMHRTPGKTLAHLQRRVVEMRREGDGRVYINLGTEPSIDRAKFPNDLKDLVREYLLALQWAVANGIRVAAPHGAFYGLWTDDDWKTLEPLSTYIAEHPDLLIFTVDEYFVGHGFSGVEDKTIPHGTVSSEEAHIYPDTWKKSPTGTYYHKGRITRFFKWLQANGKPLPRTIITEDGADALQDVEKWRTSLIRTDGYDNIRGWKSLAEQWRVWYQAWGWSVQRAFFEMLYAIWKAAYADWPNIEGSAIYCWGTNNDIQWNQFRVDGAYEFQALMEAADWGIEVEEPKTMVVDISKYIVGLPGRTHKLAGMGDETLRTRVVNGYSYQDKNEHWEQIWFDKDRVYRGADTSPGNGNYYVLYEGNRYGSVWSPRNWETGKTFKRTATVKFYRKSDNALVTSYVDVTHLKFAKFHKSYTFRSGITMANVIELHAMKDKNGQPDTGSFETYFYAEGWGLVGWVGSGVGESYISALAGTPKTPETISLIVPAVPPVIEDIPTYPKPDNPNMPITISEVRVKSNGPYDVRIRANAGATSPIVGLLSRDGTYLPGIENEHLKTGLWRNFEFDNGVKGFISNDFIIVEPFEPDTENPVIVIPTEAELDEALNALMNFRTSVEEFSEYYTNAIAVWRSKLL